MTENFGVVQKALQEHVTKMLSSTNNLFVVDVDKDLLWKTYLDSFPVGTDPILRKRTEHDCSACRHFIKAFGNVVSIKDNVITTIWDFGSEIIGTRYEPVVRALTEFVRSRPITDVFVTDVAKFGIAKSYEQFDAGVLTWEHFHVELPSKFLNKTRKTNDTVRGTLHSLRDVFKRSLDEISQDSVQSVLELIASNSLYKGEEWKTILESFAKHQIVYAELSKVSQENYAWEQSMLAGPVISKIRNHSIGTLLVDLSKGMDLDEAVRRYESMVAPSNYKRPKAIFTQRMLQDAEKTITDLGYLSALPRRYAVLDDITINNVLFADREVTQHLSGNVFTDMAQEVAIKPKNFDKVEEVPIATFIKDILPTVQKVEVLLENQHQANMVSLIAPVHQESSSMFKWPNNFSWAYAGNITDSMKQRVKALGGDVTGVLRFSIQWNTEHDNNNDFDAHCIEPTKNEIYFARKHGHKSSGDLDVDIITPFTHTKDGIAVENITWSNKARMPEGTYKLFVHNFCHRGGRSGFSAEVEFDGKVYSFFYNKELRPGENVHVAEVTYSKTNGFSIVEKIPSSMSSRKIWNLDSNKFQPVSIIMYSPNYWNEQEGIGNKHYFFMLKDCKNPESPNGFFNEYLKNELLEHKRVFEALGAKMKVPESDDQLSGLGFSSTQRNSLVVRTTGHVNRVMKIIF